MNALVRTTNIKVDRERDMRFRTKGPENTRSVRLWVRDNGRGDEGDRTLDLRLAKPALYQLSYVPGEPSLQDGDYSGWWRRVARSRWRSMRSS